MSSHVKIGLIGCGNISNAYFTGAGRFEVLQLVACADLDPARAQAQAEKYPAVRACTVDELLADPEIQIVVNLTIPQAHGEVNECILRAGKHAYTEKPFALNTTEAARVNTLARELGLLVGGAPDTFLGGGIQTARKLIDEGAIGTPVAAMAFMLCRGHESWHPAPEFYYKQGGGPMFDMGPYYVTALVNLLGPAKRVSGAARATFPERLITSQPLNGAKITVDVPTHYAGTIEFHSGAVATVVMSFDVWPGKGLPCLTVYGTGGTMEVPDPNTFLGPVRIYGPNDKEGREIPLTHSDDRGRGTGVADMAYSLLRRGRPHRASGALALHVVEIMEAFEKSSVEGRHVVLATTCARPAMLPVGLGSAVLDT